MEIVQFPHPKQRISPSDIRLVQPPNNLLNPQLVDRFEGCLLGLATGDALGASVEFRPHQYLVENPVKGMQSGGTWGLQAGKWTDDTSMALCLASSLLTRRQFDPYNQLVRYKWWYKYGYLSSTGQCFDIGHGTRQALEEFSRRQQEVQRATRMNEEELDSCTYQTMLNSNFDVVCGSRDGCGNGALMRLAPVPLFYYHHPQKAVQFSGESARLTHGDRRAIDACRYFGALIVAALHGESKENLISSEFYLIHQKWFEGNELHPDIQAVANGSFRKKNGYEKGIRGSGNSVQSLEAALWAFANDENSFEKGVLAAVNLGDDSDTTGAIYGQLAGASYGLRQIPDQWIQQLYAKSFISSVAKWLLVIGNADPAIQSVQQLIPAKATQLPKAPTHSYYTSNSNPPRMVTNTHYRPPLLNSNASVNNIRSHNQHKNQQNYQNSSSWSWFRHDQ